jgi:hypothetical protein
MLSRSKKEKAAVIKPMAALLPQGPPPLPVLPSPASLLIAPQQPKAAAAGGHLEQAQAEQEAQSLRSGQRGGRWAKDSDEEWRNVDFGSLSSELT